LRRATISFVMSARPSAWNDSTTTRRMFMKFYIWLFSNYIEKNSSFVKIRQEYMKTNIHFQSYFSQLFLEWKMFQTKVAEKLKIHILCPLTFVRKSCILWNNVEKYCRAGQRIACWVTKATNTYTVSVILIAFLLQKSLHGGSSMLRYTYFSCLVFSAVLAICLTVCPIVSF
jgi:hypothetical protein